PEARGRTALPAPSGPDSPAARHPTTRGRRHARPQRRQLRARGPGAGRGAPGPAARTRRDGGPGPLMTRRARGGLASDRPRAALREPLDCGYRPTASTYRDAGMQATWTTIGLLTLSNVFMTFAWYAHLKELGSKPWIVAALISWGVAFFEYMLQVPANRIGYQVMTLGQLKILQEVITLTVFVPFAVLYMKEPLKLDYLWAGLCMLGAVYFMFRDKLGA